MAKYFVNTKNGKEYIKEIDFAKGTLTFTKNEDEAYDGRGGYYATPLKDQISRGFVDDYPQVANLQIDERYY